MLQYLRDATLVMPNVYVLHGGWWVEGGGQNLRVANERKLPITKSIVGRTRTLVPPDHVEDCREQGYFDALKALQAAMIDEEKKKAEREQFHMQTVEEDEEELCSICGGVKRHKTDDSDSEDEVLVDGAEEVQPVAAENVHPVYPSTVVEGVVTVESTPVSATPVTTLNRPVLRPVAAHADPGVFYYVDKTREPIDYANTILDKNQRNFLDQTVQKYVTAHDNDTRPDKISAAQYNIIKCAIHDRKPLFTMRPEVGQSVRVWCQNPFTVKCGYKLATIYMVEEHRLVGGTNLKFKMSGTTMSTHVDTDYMVELRTVFKSTLVDHVCVTQVSWLKETVNKAVIDVLGYELGPPGDNYSFD